MSELNLLHNLLIQSAKDTLAGDHDAAAWLADVGADLAYFLGIVEDPESVRAWAHNPTRPRTVSTAQAATMAGCTRGCIIEHITRGNIIAYKDPLCGHSNTYAVPVSEARLFAYQYRRMT